MNPWVALGAATFGYLLGSVSFARIVGRRVVVAADLAKTDLDLPGGATIEYRGVSATSIGARTGPRWGMVVGLADAAKAFVPVLVIRLIWPADAYHLVAAVAVMLGHNYPVFHHFRGGRGQSPLYGGLLAIDWLAVPVTTAIGFVVGIYVLRDILVAYTLGQWLLIPWFWWRGGPPEVIYAIVVNLLFTVAAVPEMREYLEKRRSGELRVPRTWSELRRSHPAMGPDRSDNRED